MRIPSLDGLRAISILAVLVGHFAYCIGPHSFITDEYAHAGVLIFFIISGYLITSLMLRDTALGVGNFWARRAWRILPCALVYMAAITVTEWPTLARRVIFFVWTYMASWAELGAHPAKFPWDFSHLWSLSVEEQFYFVWPVILFLGNKRAAKFAAWVVVVTAPVARLLFARAAWGMAELFSPPAVADSIAFGCLLALYWPQVREWKIIRSKSLGAIWLFAIFPLDQLSTIHRFRPLPQLIGHAGWTIFNVAVTLGIAWAIVNAPKVLNWKPLVWIGILSYSLYLWQMPMTNPAYPIPFWARICGVITLAMASYYLVERPTLRLRYIIEVGLREIRRQEIVIKEAEAA